MTEPPASLPKAARPKRAARTAYISLLIGAVALVFYALIAPVAAPRLAHFALESRATSTGDCSAQAERISFEPFSLTFHLENVLVAGLDNEVTASAQLARADFSARSLFSARPVLDRLDIRGGALRGTPEAAFAFCALFEILVTDARIAALDAEVTTVALASPASYRTSPSLRLRGADLELSAGRGTLTVALTNALGDGSQLDARLQADAAAGPRLSGTATLTSAEVAFGQWRLAAPNVAISIAATWSPPATASFSLLDGTLAVIDTRADARFELTDGSARASWWPATGLHELEASGSLAHGGRAALELAHGANGALRLSSQLTSLPATDLAPYTARALGVAPASGTVSVEVSASSGDPAVTDFAKIVAHAFRPAAEEPTSATAIALLERPNGEIAMEVPLVADRGAAEQIVEYVAEQVTAVVTAPFAALAALVGRDALELSKIEFIAGTAEPTARGHEVIAALAEALSLRPGIGVQVQANEQAALDRAALARSQVELHVTLATARAERAATSIDFAALRVHGVLDEFAGERLSAAALEEIGAAFPFDAAAPPGAPERVAHYRALFEALVEREPISDTALRRLANFRGRTIERRLGELGVAGAQIIDAGAGLPGGDRVLAVLPLALEAAPASDPRPEALR